ncbi:hypothetical protein KKG31_04390, partial [Patescibacteria group bacterium]|nr:hypothetical protein [Patescibacteria group bacterium]
MVFLFGLAYAQFGFCGDGVCDERLEEDAQTCPEDCGGTDEFCGDGICNEEIEENVETCPEDCEGIPPEDEDWDMDGIPNAEDECPDDPETYNDYQDEDGCPDEEQ